MESPKLPIFKTTDSECFATAKKVSVPNLDTVAYVNSKFAYVIRQILMQIKFTYKDVSYPVEFAHDIMK